MVPRKISFFFFFFHFFHYPSSSRYQFQKIGNARITSSFLSYRIVLFDHRCPLPGNQFPGWRLGALICTLFFDLVGIIIFRQIMMDRRWWLRVVILICLFTSSVMGRDIKFKVKHKHHLVEYNHTLAATLAEYASAVYLSELTELFTWTCSRCNGLTEGFEMIELIVDVRRCLQGFVGVAQDLNAIVVAFRGTQETSIQNWIEDLYWKQLDLNYPGIDDAMVHHGFYSAYHNTSIRPAVLDAIAEAKEIYGDLKIMVTGHSMGGAMAAFCGLDLVVNTGAKDVQVTTFGQPRIGNAAFVSYYSELVPNTIRITHEHDIVPHLPPYYRYFPQKTYKHFPREVWIHNVGFESLIYPIEKVCDGSGEDPTCSRSVTGNSISDHLIYYGIQMGCDNPGNKCRIIFLPRTDIDITPDLEGNLLLSRNRSSYISRSNSRSSDQVNSM